MKFIEKLKFNEHHHYHVTYSRSRAIFRTFEMTHLNIPAIEEKKFISFVMFVAFFCIIFNKNVYFLYNIATIRSMFLAYVQTYIFTSSSNIRSEKVHIFFCRKKNFLGFCRSFYIFYLLY